MPIAYLPHVAPKNNNTRQLRRRYTDTQSQVDQNTSDIETKAPVASPTFSGTVTQPTPAALTAAPTSTSATAGSATALPTAPLGYLVQTINGVKVKIPYYSE